MVVGEGGLSRRLPIAAVLLVFAVNLALKISTAHVPSLFLDEVASIWYAQHGWEEFLVFLGRDASPPLYSILLRGWIGIFGISEIAVRSLSVLAASTIPVSVLVLTWRAYGWKAAALATFIVTLAPVQLEFAQQSRSYVVVAACAALSMVCFHRVMRDGSKRAFLGLVLADLGMLYTHYTSGLLIVARLAALPGYGVRDRKRLVRLAAAQFVVGVLFLPGLLRIQPAQIAEPQRWYHSPTVGALWGQWSGLCGGRLAGFVMAASISLAVVLALREIRRRRSVGEAGQVLLLALSWSLGTLGLSFIVSQKIPIFELRYLVPLAAGIPVAAVWAVGAFRDRPMRLLHAAVLTAVALGAFRPVAPIREDWKGAASWVRSHRRPGDIVVVSAGYQCRTLVYALDRELFQVVKDPHRVWFERERLICVDVLEPEVLKQLQPRSVILVQSHSGAVDPENRSLQSLSAFAELQQTEIFRGIRLVRALPTRQTQIPDEGSEQGPREGL